MVRDLPPDNAYGRVTDPERYRIVVRAAEQVVAELEATYQVEVQRGGAELDPELSAGPTVEQVIRLVPALEDAATLNVVLTDFPGVRVRAGRWHNLDSPSCGCDACDERPYEVAVDLTRRLRAVAAGGLVEALRGGIRPQLTTSLADDEGNSRASPPSAGASRSRWATRSATTGTPGPDVRAERWPAHATTDRACRPSSAAVTDQRSPTTALSRRSTSSRSRRRKAMGESSAPTTSSSPARTSNRRPFERSSKCGSAIQRTLEPAGPPLILWSGRAAQGADAR